MRGPSEGKAHKWLAGFGMVVGSDGWCPFPGKLRVNGLSERDLTGHSVSEGSHS